MHPIEKEAMDIREPLEIKGPEGAKIVVKALYANDVKWVRANSPSADLDEDEMVEIIMKFF